MNDTTFYYDLQGNGQPLVLISGLKGDHSGWQPVIGELSKQYQILVFDNRGVGQTVDSGAPFSVETMADDVMSLINKFGLKKPHIVGHSLGGAIAQVMARKYADNISSIALCNTFLKFNDLGKKIFTDVLSLHQDLVSPADIMGAILPWVFSKKFLSVEVIEIIRKVSNESKYPQSLTGYSRQLKALYDFDSREWASEINLLTLIIASDEDKIATLEESMELHASINNSKLSIISSSHGSQVEQPEVFINYLNDFYSKLKFLTKTVDCNIPESVSLRP